QTRKLIRYFRSRDRDSDRHPIAKALCRSNDVRLDIPVLNAKPFFARTPPRGLHFVGDEKASVFTRDLDCALEIYRRWNDKAANSENGLSHERRNLSGRRRHNQFFDVVGAGESAFRVSELERTAITVRRARMHET